MPISGSYRVVSHFGQYHVEGLKGVTLDLSLIHISFLRDYTPEPPYIAGKPGQISSRSRASVRVAFGHSRYPELW